MDSTNARTRDGAADASMTRKPGNRHGRFAVVHQPGDGDCLFHSLLHGTDGVASARALRQDLARFAGAHPDVLLGGARLEDWVLWEAGVGLAEYARGMELGHRVGGMVEVALYAHTRACRVDVYCGGRIAEGPVASAGDFGPMRRIVWWGAHYDALDAALAS
jgi:hypothetical protein